MMKDRTTFTETSGHAKQEQLSGGHMQETRRRNEGKFDREPSDRLGTPWTSDTQGKIREEESWAKAQDTGRVLSGLRYGREGRPGNWSPERKGDRRGRKGKQRLDPHAWPPRAELLQRHEHRRGVPSLTL